jgi:hypothetical protein
VELFEVEQDQKFTTAAEKQARHRAISNSPKNITRVLVTEENTKYRI